MLAKNKANKIFEKAGEDEKSRRGNNYKQVLYTVSMSCNKNKFFTVAQ